MQLHWLKPGQICTPHRLKIDREHVEIAGVYWIGYKMSWICEVTHCWITQDCNDQHALNDIQLYNHVITVKKNAFNNFQITSCLRVCDLHRKKEITEPSCCSLTLELCFCCGALYVPVNHFQTFSPSQTFCLLSQNSGENFIHF